MDAAAMKHMALNFAKLDKFEGVDFRRWQKKMHFLLSSMRVVYVLTTPILEDGGDDSTVEQVRKRAKWDNDDYVCKGLILNGMYNDNKGKCKHHDITRADPNKKSKVTCWKCGKPRHLKKDCKGGKVGNKANGSGKNGSADGSTNSLKDLRFSSGKIISLFNVLHVPNIRKNLVSSSVLNNCGYKQVIESNKFVLSKHAFMSTSKLNDSIIWHARLGQVHFTRMQDMSKDGLIPAFDMDTEK
ncbi:zinc finger, CCHC-type containing protein, partial [Tanacetum coccineum]